MICAYQESGSDGGFFSARCFASSRPNHQLSTEKERKNYMNPLTQCKTTIVLFISVLVLGCFVLLPQMRAAPNEGTLLPESFSGTNTFDGLHALAHSTGTFNSAFGW